MNAHLAYAPIMPEQDFTTTVVFGKGVSGEIGLSVPEGLNIEGAALKEVKDGEIKWVLNGGEGEYLLEYDFNNKKYTQEVLITKGKEYKPPVKNVKDGNIDMIKVEHKKNII